jgi:hypothetical protein
MSDTHETDTLIELVRAYVASRGDVGPAYALLNVASACFAAAPAVPAAANAPGIAEQDERGDWLFAANEIGNLTGSAEDTFDAQTDTGLIFPFRDFLRENNPPAALAVVARACRLAGQPDAADAVDRLARKLKKTLF